MKKQKTEFTVNLIGEADLSKLSDEAMELLVAAYIKGLREYLSQKNGAKEEN